MKLKVLPIALLTSAGLGAGANAQGLLSIGSDDDFYSALPFTTSIGVSAGWDSNPNSSADNAQDSSYIQGGVDMAYGSASKTTPVKFGLGVSGLYYFDDIQGQENDVLYNARLSLNVSHSYDRRLVVGNNFYLTYESQPDYSIGAADQSRLDQYLYGYNSLWASYELSRRFSAITRYTVSGIRYDESYVGDFEDRFTQMFGEELRYMWDRRNTLVAEYRFTYTDYDTAPRDYTQNTFLLGLDHDFSRTLTGSFRGGAEIRDWDSDLLDDSTEPYFEASLRSRVSERTEIVWLNRVGLEDAELTGFEDRYAYRSSLSASHAINSKLRVHGGLSYVYSDFQGGDFRSDVTENLVSVSVGLGYRLFNNVDLTTDYTYTGVSSDEEFREYDRNRVSLGLSATF